jgi:hypothetical protein
MLIWKAIAAFFQTWYGTVAGTIGILATVFNGIPTVFRTWDYLIARFVDEPVLDILREYNFLAEELRPPKYKDRTALSVNDLAEKLKRSHRSIGKTIVRLKRRDLIELYKGGFRLKG